MSYRISVCAILLLLAPALASAQQDPVPSPPKQEIVSIRSAGGTLDLKGLTSADLFEFTQQCDPRQGYSGSVMSLTLPLEIDGGPNGSLEDATRVLREAVAKGFLVKVESNDPQARAPLALFVWGNRSGTFEGVIDGLSVKYTMFMPDGAPARATATLRVTEANKAAAKKSAKDADTADAKKEPDCSPKQ